MYKFRINFIENGPSFITLNQKIAIRCILIMWGNRRLKNALKIKFKKKCCNCDSFSFFFTFIKTYIPLLNYLLQYYLLSINFFPGVNNSPVGWGWIICFSNKRQMIQNAEKSEIRNRHSPEDSGFWTQRGRCISKKYKKCIF